MINYHTKGLYKKPVIKKSPTFLSFFSRWLLYELFPSFLVKVFSNFEKWVRFQWQVFIVYEIGENLKMQTEIFCLKRIASNVILAFLDHLKPKISSSANHGGWHRAPTFSKSLNSPLPQYACYIDRTCFDKLFFIPLHNWKSLFFWFFLDKFVISLRFF